MPPPVTASLAMPAPAAGALRAFLDHLVSKHGRGLEPGPGARRLGGTAPGRVALVGAGPGDPELLTLRAARLIGEADVLVLDHLVGEGVLELARPGTERIYVGKRHGEHSQPELGQRALGDGLERYAGHFGHAGSCLEDMQKGADLPRALMA